MQMGESLLVLGAIVILSTTVLYINVAKLESHELMMGTEFQSTAMGIAHTYIEEAQRMKFDEVLITMAFSGTLPNEFTAPGSLGPETSEVYANFDDIDDFNNYSANVPTSRADYDVRIYVTYSDTINFMPSVNRSYFKIMSVMISSQFFKDTLMYNYLFSYY